MNVGWAEDDAEDGVIAGLHYNVPASERPVICFYPHPPPELEHRKPRRAPQRVRIHSARPFVRALSLDVHGFVLVQRATRVTDFHDELAIRAIYYAEAQHLVREATGAARVLVSGHVLRRSRNLSDGIRLPARDVHNDYTISSGHERAAALLAAESLPVGLPRRFAAVNVWRSINGPVREAALALCDARTVALEDLVATELRFADGETGENYGIKFNPCHRWFYFPRMDRDEVLLFKCFDSLETGVARFTPHSAFDTGLRAAEAPPRESIEVRTFAFFD